MAATQIVKETHKNNSMQFVFDNEIGFQGEQLIAASNNHAVEAAIKQLRDAFSRELNNYSQKNRNAIRQAITSASALRNDLNQEDQFRQALGGEQWIRSASCLFNLADLGGYVVCDASLTEFETKIRVAFTGTDISEQFDLIFQRLFFIPNIGGKDRYDAVLHFRCRSGSNDANQRALIKAFFTSEEFKQEFGSPIILSSYRAKRNQSKKRDASKKRKTDDASNEEDVSSNTVEPIVVSSTTISDIDNDDNNDETDLPWTAKRVKKTDE